MKKNNGADTYSDTRPEQKKKLEEKKKRGGNGKTKDNSKTRGKKKRHASVVKLFVFCVSRVLYFLWGICL